MDDNFDQLRPPQPINPYEASTTTESYYAPPITSGNGNVAMWLGVFSLISGFIGMSTFCCFLSIIFNFVGIGLGAFGLVLGLREMKAVRTGYSHPSNRSTGQMGVIFGGIGLGISLLGVLAFAGFMVFAIMA